MDSATYRIKTKRLLLRELHDSDAPALARIGGDPRVAPNLFAMTVPWPQEAALKWLQHFRFRDRLGFRLAVCLQGELIGTLYLGQAPGEGAITTAYFIDPDHWGQGFATEAMYAMLADAMPRFGVAELWADHFADNPASGAVMRKLGFEQIKTGMGTSAARVEQAPIVIYRLLASDLKAPTP